MTNICQMIAGLVLGILVLAGPAAAQEPGGPLTLRSKKAAFDDVKFELTNAIVNRGLVVDFNGHIARMLERTGADVGSTKPIYRQAEYVTFCSARLSRQTMEADTANIAFCPYVIFIYETAAEPGATHVGFRRLPQYGSELSKTTLGAINALLDGIVAEAVN